MISLHKRDPCWIIFLRVSTKKSRVLLVHFFVGWGRFEKNGESRTQVRSQDFTVTELFSARVCTYIIIHVLKKTTFFFL